MDSGTKLSKLSVTELQLRYLEVVGRPTGSSHKRYLMLRPIADARARVRLNEVIAELFERDMQGLVEFTRITGRLILCSSR